MTKLLLSLLMLTTPSLDWRFNEFRSEGIVPESVFKRRCVRVISKSYWYWVWEEHMIAIPDLDSEGNVMECEGPKLIARESKN